MGYSTTPKYVIVLDGKEHDSMAWDCKRYGRPTAANLEKFVMTYAKSLEADGCNAHLSAALGHIPYPRSAFIKFNERNGAVVASWKAAMFQVYA